MQVSSTYIIFVLFTTTYIEQEVIALLFHIISTCSHGYSCFCHIQNSMWQKQLEILGFSPLADRDKRLEVLETRD